MMMAEFMMMLIQMSIQASVIVLVVLVIRKLFEWLRISKKYTMLLWIIPFFCLVCPWKISVPVGFWNFAPVDVVTQANEKAAAEAAARARDELIRTDPYRDQGSNPPAGV